MGAWAQGWQLGENVEARRQARQQQLQDQQRQSQENALQSQLASGAITGLDYSKGINDLYAHEPAESRLGRIGRGLERAVGMKKRAAAQAQAAQAKVAALPSPRADLNRIEAGAKTPEQLARESAALRLNEVERLQQLKNEGAEAVARLRGQNPTGRPVPFGRGSVSVKDAQQLSAGGLTFSDQDGNPIDVSKLPETSKLTPWAWGGKIFYTIGDQVPRVITADNQRTVQPEEGALAPAGSAPTLGAARVGTVRTATAPGGGQVVTGTATPMTPGTKAPAPRKAGGNASQATGSILPNVQGMTPQNAAAARKSMPAVTAEMGLFGDPQNPNVKSMADFIPLANKPHAQKVLGEAFKLLDQQMGEISDPGIIQTLGTAAGWANFRAQAESGAKQATGTQMTPEEREYFDTAIASMADIIGSRSATGQSPARFSVRSIQNELPLIGLSGTPDAASYTTKLNTIARQIEVGLNGMPDNSRALAWLKKRQGDLQPKRPASSSTGTMKFADGGKHYSIPAAKVEAFKGSHPNATEE